MAGPTRRTPSMYDVAARAGVSHVTVSRVLNGLGNTRPETAQRVMAAIRELGYRPNPAARALVTSRSRAIGVLAPATADYGPTNSLQAVENALRGAGYQPLITTTRVEPAAVRASLGFLLDHSVEGIVVIASYQVLLNELEPLMDSFPIVALQTGSTDVGIGVSIDQEYGARLAVEHLVKLGHRRIQQVTGPADFIAARARAAAVTHVLQGWDVSPLPDIAGDWTPEAGYRAAFELHTETTAVVCANDQVAIGMLNGLHHRGLEVPSRISVVGFDDIPEAAYTIPPLTTVHQDFKEVGRRAVAHLLAHLEGVPVDPAHAEPPQQSLVVRASTGSVAV